MSAYKFGFVGIIGRPNVGKSTLTNALVGHKVSIISKRAQTTRHRIMGVLTEKEFQAVFVDTPGIHQSKQYFNRIMNRAAASAVNDVDLILFMIESTGWTEADEAVLKQLKRDAKNIPIILVINKIDKLRTKERLLPLLQHSATMYDFAEIIPLSAQTKNNKDRLLELLQKYLPENEAGFPADVITDKTEKFMAAELVREQLFETLGQELPYAAAVAIEEFKREPKLYRIDALILVEKQSQKSIVIGADGDRLKFIGTKARLEMEKIYGQKVFLKLWVKVRESWAEDELMLKSLGYIEN